MSGGTFDYQQYKISEIRDQIEREIERQGKPKSKDELYMDDEYYEKYPDELVHYQYPEDIVEEFKNAVTILKKAEIYVQRIDWLIAGDDGEDSFRRRLKEELKK